jgi:D-lyxose ketol-isomerase
MEEADAFMKANGFYLPPFAYWTPEDWRAKGEEVREIADHQLGWDITDFGSGRYEKIGLFIFTVRNGSLQDLEKGDGKIYCEKILVADVDQVTPMHFHFKKVEDIINRGGGKLAIEVFNSTADEDLDKTSDVTVVTDGVRRVVKAGETLVLGRGESITLPSYQYHKFWGIEERVLVGEVSAVNDDSADNRFHQPTGRFPQIEEDEPPLHLLCTDYPKYYSP